MTWPLLNKHLMTFWHLTIWRQPQSWLNSKLETREQKTTQDKKKLSYEVTQAGPGAVNTSKLSSYHLSFRRLVHNTHTSTIMGPGAIMKKENFQQQLTAQPLENCSLRSSTLHCSNLKIGFTWSTVQEVHTHQHFTLVRLLELWMLVKVS